MTREELLAENKRKDKQIAALKFRLSELERLVFGSKRERYVPAVADEQLDLGFQEDTSLLAPPVEQEQAQANGKASKQASRNDYHHHPGRRTLPTHLPVQEIIVEPEQSIEGLAKLGQDITETLDYVPASLRINRYIFPKYVLEDKEGGSQIIRGKMPVRPIDKGIPEAGLLAHLISQKFVYHQPFYRSIAQFKDLYGVGLPKASVNDWFTSVCELMQPLYASLKKQVLASDYLQADESPIKVLDKDKIGSTHQGYQWVYHTPQTGLVLFNYQKGRGKQGPKTLLEHYEGYLQTDGYVVYDKIAKHKSITLLGCMAHARRYFFKAQDSDPIKADQALNYFRQLYQIERNLKEQHLLPEQIKAIRQQQAKPILNQLHNWAIQQKDKVLPKSPMGKALNYLLAQWPKLIKYLEDGRLLIDNNLIENSIRPLALGRKNYLFAGSHAAAQRIAMMYSFFASCKKLDINPYAWLRTVLQKIPTHPINQLQELLPGPGADQLDKE